MTFCKLNKVNFKIFISKLHDLPKKYPFAYYIFTVLLVMLILIKMWGINSATITFILSCFLLTGLIFICINKVCGGGYVLLISVLCNLPAYFVRQHYKSIDKVEQYQDFFKQWIYTFALIFIAFLFVIIIDKINSYAKPAKFITFFLRIISSLVLLIPASYSICYLINWVMGNPLLGSDAILAFYQTNFSEASSYVTEMINLKRALLVFSVLALILVLAYKTVSSSFIKINWWSLCLLLACIFISYKGYTKYSYNIYTAPFADAKSGLNDYLEYSKLTKQRAKDSSKFINNADSVFDGTYVVVIGESESRVNMNCYGYKEKNTPFQTNLMKQNNSIFFKNAFSNHTHTVPVLEYALTSKNQYENRNLGTKDIVSLLEVAKYSLGYHTVWISNQNKIGIYDNPISVIADSADEKFWTHSYSKTYSATPYDENLLPFLDNLKLSKDKNLIFVHLMGSHVSYVDRYPASYSKFNSESEVVNTYNNSIYYNDHILDLILQSAKKLPNFKGMLYFSDHGDDAVTQKYHNSADFTYPMAEIPFWMYFSDSYINDHKEIFDSLKTHVNTPYTNDLLFDTVLGILGAHNSQFYKAENDISSYKYNHTFYDIRTLHGNKTLIPPLTSNDKAKLWLHRVDSPEKLKELGDKYDGVEFDIVYHEDLDDFENSHDRSSSIEFSLDNQLRTLVTLKNGMNKKIWFDFKNLSTKNKEFAKKRLIYLLKKYNIPIENCWVESRDYESLDIFKKNGFKTSYYFPYYEFDKMNSNEILYIRKVTENILNLGNVDAISFYHKYYNFIKQLNIKNNIYLLTWIDDVDRSVLEKDDNNLIIIKDPSVKVVLVRELGNYTR